MKDELWGQYKWHIYIAYTASSSHALHCFKKQNTGTLKMAQFSTMKSNARLTAAQKAPEHPPLATLPHEQK